MTNRYDYDALGQRIAGTDGLGNATVYAYDALGRPVTRNLDEFGYNARGEVAWARYGTNTLADIYHYDFIGNFTSNRLRGAWSQFAANELNEYTFVAASNPRQLAYDLDGNLLTNGVWSYVYDSLNRLSEIVFNGELALQISYDTRSRCIKRLMPQGDYYYFYDDRNIIYENEMSVGGNSELYYGKDIRGALHQFGNVGGILSIQTSHHAYMFYDAHGNIVEMNDSIGPESFFNYDVFGNSMNSVGISSRPTQFGYSSKELLKIANLYDYGHRFYTAELGRWTSRDPLGEAVSLNRYTFVRNNPNIFFDAYGLEQTIFAFDDVRLVLGRTCSWSSL